MAEQQYYDLVAWIGGKKTKIGYARLDEKWNVLKLKADSHIDASKLGRMLLKGDIQIDHRQHQPKPKEVDTSYSSAADSYDE